MRAASVRTKLFEVGTCPQGHLQLSLELCGGQAVTNLSNDHPVRAKVEYGHGTNQPFDADQAPVRGSEQRPEFLERGPTQAYHGTPLRWRVALRLGRSAIGYLGDLDDCEIERRVGAVTRPIAERLRQTDSQPDCPLRSALLRCALQNAGELSFVGGRWHR